MSYSRLLSWAWFEKVSGTVVRSTLRAVPATVPDTFLNHALICALLAWATGNAALGAEAIRIVDRGQPKAMVVLPAKADAQLKQAAELLVRYVKQSSGTTLPIVSEPEAKEEPGRTGIHVGPTQYVKRLGLGLERLDDDGFVLRGVDRQHLVIAGPTAWGTEFGVGEFLERYVGVRWLLPGPDGDDVPSHAVLDVPLEEVRQEPAFFSRLFSGLRGGAQTTWARRNRMHGRVEFHHNLLRLFPPEEYAKTRPELFPIRDGKRYLPPTNDTHGWQPCFSAEGSVEEAIANICRWFDGHPGAPSYSLGVTDSSGHCQCEKCQAKDTGKKNFLGYRDVSDRYFDWCNRVVEGVLKKYPDKWFGCLAYSEVGQAPSRVKVHPRIIPYMTYDRMKWIDPELRADGEEMTRRWHKMSPVVGWYDYIYGSPYCLPRVWFHQMADYYRFGHGHGVRALYAEAYPNWGEGPKLYVSLKLQWDPSQDVDRLLRDWYLRAVGKEAAADLAAYYAYWEDFWTRRILKSKWFTKHGQYLAFHSDSYLADVTEDEIRQSRALLERTVEKAGTDKQKARARLLLRAFEFYEASALSYSLGRADEPSPRSEAEALAVLDRGIARLHMAQKRERLVFDDFANDPVLVHPIPPRRRGQLRSAQPGSLWRVFDWAGKSQAVRRRLGDLAASPDDMPSLQAKTMLAVLDGSHQPISKNPSFEDPQGKWPADWRPWVKFGVGRKTVSSKAARTGKLGVLCQGMKRGGPYQDLQVQPGSYGAVAFVRVPQEPKGNATIALSLTPLDEKGENLPALITTIHATACDWTPIAIGGELPEKLGNRNVKKVRLVVIVDGFEAGGDVHIDDVALYKLP